MTSTTHPGPEAIEPEPADCKEHCVVATAPKDFADCCDSITCYVDPDTRKWVEVFCDPPPPPADAFTPSGP